MTNKEILKLTFYSLVHKKEVTVREFLETVQEPEPFGFWDYCLSSCLCKNGIVDGYCVRECGFDEWHANDRQVDKKVRELLQTINK